MNGRKAPITVRGTAWLIALSLCLFASGAMGDGLMPMMPAPPETPVYWQLVSVEQESDVSPSGGYDVSFQVDGLSLDLSDGLMAESLIESDGETWNPVLSLSISKGDTAMEHAYGWTALPVYLEPNTDYAIEVSGSSAAQSGHLNSLMGIYQQGTMTSRLSAGGYTGHPDTVLFSINASATPLYNDGSLIYSFIVRDVNDMFRLRVVYTYRMQGGIKPEPTPIPGFVAVEMPQGVLPDYYDPAPGVDALWVVTTKPDEYRAYGSMNGSDPMFFPADAVGNVVMNETPVNPAADFDAYVKGFVPVEPAPPSETYVEAEPGLFTFTTRDGEQLYRRYGRVDGAEAAFYPSDAEGTVDAASAEPVIPAADYTDHVQGFGAARPDAMPSHYKMAGPDVYAFTGRDGETRYRVYGRLNGAQPAYYPSDETGAIAEGAAAVNPDDDFVQYIKGFDPTQPPAVPIFYFQAGDGLYAVLDREGNPAYRAHGIKDGAAPAFYPADASGIVAEDAAPVTGDEDFMTYIVGFEPINMPDAPFYYDETDTPNVWTFEDLSGQRQYRAYGILNRGEEAFYPSDAQGNVDHDALPVQPASDLANMPPPKFVKAEPQTVPGYYSAVGEGVFTFDDRDGQPVYRTFGAYGRAMPRFYPADAEGNPIDDAEPVEPEQDFATYFEGFEAMRPDGAPTYYKQIDGKEGLYAVDTRDGDVLYRVFGSKDRGEPAYYPADAHGNLAADIPMDPVDDIQLLPTPFTGGVVPAPAAQTPETTPVAREYEPGALWPEATTQTNAVVTQGAVQAPETTPVAREYEPGALWPEATTQTGAVITPQTEQAPETTPVTREYEPGALWPEATEQTSAVVAQGAEQAPETTPVTREYEAGTLWPEATTQTNEVVTAAVVQAPETTPLTREQQASPEATTLSSEVNPPQTPTEANTGVGTQLPPESPDPTASSATILQPAQTGSSRPVVTGAIGAESVATPEAEQTEAADKPAETDMPIETEVPAETASPAPEESEGGIGGIIALIAGAVVVIGGGGFFLLRKKK